MGPGGLRVRKTHNFKIPIDMSTWIFFKKCPITALCRPIEPLVLQVWHPDGVRQRLTNGLLHWFEWLDFFWWHFSPRHHSGCLLHENKIKFGIINRLQIKMENYLLWAASASQSMTPPKEENCFWAFIATFAKVSLETNPLPAACGDAGAPKYTFMFRLGDFVLAHWSLPVTNQSLQPKQQRNIVTKQPDWNLMAQKSHKSCYLPRFMSISH